MSEGISSVSANFFLNYPWAEVKIVRLFSRIKMPPETQAGFWGHGAVVTAKFLLVLQCFTAVIRRIDVDEDVFLSCDKPLCQDLILLATEGGGF